MYREFRVTPRSEPEKDRMAEQSDRDYYEQRDRDYQESHEKTGIKNCYFFKEGDHTKLPVKVVVNDKAFKRMDGLYVELSRRIDGLPFGCRRVFSAHGRTPIMDLDSFQDGGYYICSSNRRRIKKKLNIAQVKPPKMWNQSKPDSGKRLHNAFLQEYDLDQDFKPQIDYRKLVQRDRRLSPSKGASVQPKKVTIMENSNPSHRHLILLNNRTAQSFEQVLATMSDMLEMAVMRIYTTAGKRILSLSQLLSGPDAVVCTGKEHFKPMTRLYATSDAQSPAGSHDSRNSQDSRYSNASYSRRNNDAVGQRMRQKKERTSKTRGRWKVIVKTSDAEDAGTDAQVSLIVYGYKGNSGPLTLGDNGRKQFNSGNIDEFEVNVGNIGEIFKIRVSHDNSGAKPGWCCDEIRMRDMDSGEELVFPCKRWLSRDHDDYETCREIPAARRGELALPLVKYEVEVTTGDMWNGGSDANVYLTIYGEKGDTGVRQLFPGKKKCFQQGQTDHFLVEAVSLGQIKRVIIGHDATESGKGWYLEKLVVKDPWDTARFHCGRWLDGGEDDGKIVREIKAQDEYDDVLEKRNIMTPHQNELVPVRVIICGLENKTYSGWFGLLRWIKWEIERWKYQKGNDVRLFSILTNKCLRIHENGAVDGLGNSQDKSTVLRISRAVQRKCVFQSVEHPEKHLALNNGKISGDGTGGPYCEFLVRVQPDRTIMLESYKFPVQLFSFNKSGHPGDTRIYDSTPPRLFRTYCKGVFRDQGVIVLYTSTEQAIGLEKDDPTCLTALGKRNNFAKFRVHKVTNNVRKFESLAEDNCFIRMKDGEVRCQDIDDSCTHFVLEKHKTEGFVSLQSVVYRGLFIGITADGSLKSTVDTGSNNTRLYPEVIEWGNKKCTELVPFDNKVEKLEDETEILQHSQGVSDTDPQAISPQMSRHENTPEIHQSRRSSEDRKEYENNLDDAVKNITSDVIEDATHQVNEELGPEEKSNSAGSKHERVFGTGISRNNSNEGNDISKNTQDEKVREHSRMSGKSVKSNKENERDKTETEDSNLQNRSMSAKSERSAKADNDKIISEKSDVHDRRTTSARSIKSIQDHEKRVESPDKDGENQRPESVKSSSVKDVEKNIQADNTENEEQNSSSAERAHSSTADRENVPSDEKMRTASAKSTKSSKNDEVEFGNTGNKDDTIGSAKSSRSHKLSDERSVTPRQSISEDARPDSRNSTKESRPDSRHSTKESRPDSRHSTKESRPDSRHSTKESRPDSRHSTKESRPDSRLSTKESRPDSRHSTKESRQDSRHSTKENSHDTDIQKTYIN